MSTEVHSPFLIIQDFVSPSICEMLSRDLSLKVPSLDENKTPLKNERILVDVEQTTLFKTKIQEIVPQIEERYSSSVVGMETPVFQQYFENPAKPCEVHGCESSKYLRKKWVKVKDIDLVGFIWLKDFNNGAPLDQSFEVYGGKLEFPAYNFSLVPQRGTLVLYPAGPHFITAISPVLVGSLEQVKVTIKMKTPDGGLWLYQPQNFPGTYSEWFNSDV